MWKKTKEMKWKTAKLLWGDLFYDIAGAVLFAAGVYTFAGNADFAPGGITGISLLLNHVFGIPVGLRNAGIVIPHKAVLTPTNQNWNVYRLAQELERERQAMGEK